MSIYDWIVLILTLLSIILYGMYKSRNVRNIDGYILGDRELPWYNVGFSVMATQASAITFLSAPGLAYSSGMSFVQFYFGLPLAMIVLCITFVPIFHKLKIYTAYEYLEQRFDVRTRVFTAVLFLIQRGISTGITIFAPALILSTIFEINLTMTTLGMGFLVIIYTVYGGTKAVSYTQLLQMSIIFGGLILAGVLVVHLLPEHVGLSEALHIAGKSGKTNAIDFNFDLNNQYTVWTGLIGGFFLQLSYFGTDQSQVGRYLTGASVRESRMGLLMNGLLKVPMQFFILLIGVLVFAYYQYHTPPLFFNQAQLEQLEKSEYRQDYANIKNAQNSISQHKTATIDGLTQALKTKDETAIATSRTTLSTLNKEESKLREQVIQLIQKNDPNADTNDNNYIFLTFVKEAFPKGIVGLLIAIIFLASMGATASAINSLSSTTTIDIVKRFIKKEGNEQSYLRISRLSTLFWGIFTVGIALFANKVGNLLEAVNILGSLFYGTILGIFLVAFYLKKIGAKAVFLAAVLSELIVIFIWTQDVIAFLWLNLIGCCLVTLLSLIIQFVTGKKQHFVSER